MSISDFTKFFRFFSSTKLPTPPTANSEEIIMGMTADAMPVIWPTPKQSESSSVICLGASGTRKTTTIVNVLAEEAVKHPEQSFLFLDPKGDLVSYLFSALAKDASALARIIHLDPFRTGFPSNWCRLPTGQKPKKVFAWQLASLASRVTTDAGGRRDLGTGARQLDAAIIVLHAVLESPHPKSSPRWAIEAIRSDEGLLALSRLTRPDIGQAMVAAIRELSPELRVSIAARLRLAFEGLPILAECLGADSCVDLGALLNTPGAIVVIDLSQPLGVGELRSFMANLVFRMALDSLLERPSPHPADGVLTRLCIDEVQLIADTLAGALDDTVATIRSRGGSLIALTQGVSALKQASPLLLPGLMNNCRKLIARVDADSAEAIARSVAPLGTDESFGAVRARIAARAVSLPTGDFYWLDAGKRIRFTATPVDVAAWKETLEHEVSAIEEVKQRFALPKISGYLPLLEAARGVSAPMPTSSGTTSTPKKKPRRWG